MQDKGGKMKKKSFRILVGIGLLAMTSGIIGSQCLMTGKKYRGYKTGEIKCCYNLLNQWLALRQGNETLEKYFHEKNYTSIGIYGVGQLGCRLSDELYGTDITIIYGIDQDPGNTYADYKVYSLDEEYPNVDVIVITEIFAFEKIKKDLKKKITCPIISLEDIIYSL